MVHRLAIILSSITAAVILAIGFAANGSVPPAAPAIAKEAVVTGAASFEHAVADAPDEHATSDAKPITRIKTTTIYVKPAPRPKVIHVTRNVPAPKRPARNPSSASHHTSTRTTHRGHDDEDDDHESEHEDHHDDHGDDGEQEPGDD